MAQFDVYKNPALSKTRVPLLLDVQADLLGVLATRVVVPLVKPAEVNKRAIKYLHFEVELEGRSYIALVSELAAIPLGALGSRVGNITARRSEIIGALDLLFTGT